MTKVTVGRGLRTMDAAIPPTTKGWASYAQLRLDNTVARANAKNIEALKVDGSPLYVWIRSYTGVSCTCTSRPPQPDSITPDDNNIFPGDKTNTGATGPKTTEELQAGNNSEDMGASPFRVRRVRTGIPVTPGASDPGWNKILNPSSNPDETGLTDNILSEDQVNAILAHTQDDITPEELAIQASEPSSGVISGGDKNNCGICLSTGYVDGFKLHNGQRIILDASDNIPIYQLSGTVSINRQKYPATFESDYDGSSYVSWTIELPTYFQSVASLRVRNNTSDALGANIEYRIAGSSDAFQVLTTDVLTARNGTATKLEIRVRPNPDSQPYSGTFYFTHLEIYYVYSTLPVGQAQNLTVNTNFEVYDRLLNMTAEISGEVPYLDKECVFQESKFGKIWKIIDITPRYTQSLQLFGYEANCRLVQNFEKYQVLSLIGQNTIIRPYTGLQQVQGDLINPNRLTDQFNKSSD